jgi:hypothetical protein
MRRRALEFILASKPLRTEATRCTVLERRKRPAGKRLYGRPRRTCRSLFIRRARRRTDGSEAVQGSRTGVKPGVAEL